MDPKTTTRRRRHSAAFVAIERQRDRRGLPDRLAVLDVGPGMAVKYLGRFHTAGELLRRFETGVRRIPMPLAWFESYETAELLDALAGHEVSITVIDINPKVLRVIARQLAPVPVATVRADIGKADNTELAALYGRFDVVVALNVLSRVRAANREAARYHLRHLLKPGGIMLADGGVPGPEYEASPDHRNLFVKPQDRATLRGIGRTPS